MEGCKRLFWIRHRDAVKRSSTPNRDVTTRGNKPQNHSIETGHRWESDWDYGNTRITIFRKNNRILVTSTKTRPFYGSWLTSCWSIADLEIISPLPLTLNGSGLSSIPLRYRQYGYIAANPKTRMINATTSPATTVVINASRPSLNLNIQSAEIFLWCQKNYFMCNSPTIFFLNNIMILTHQKVFWQKLI